MKFEFTVHPAFNFVTSFAERFGLDVHNNRVDIPERLGQGYIKEIITDDNIKLVLHNYRLNEDFHLKRLGPSPKSNPISIVFNSNEIPTDDVEDKERLVQFLDTHESTIQIASSAVATETFFQANSNVRFLVIGMPTLELDSLLNVKDPNEQVQTILDDNQTSFFFHERMSAEIREIFNKLFEDYNQASLLNLFYWIKIQELIYLLFDKLLRRENVKQHSLNEADIVQINKIHAAILADISEPPNLSKLEKTVGMSGTKMKKLFKQIYGDSIYNYYLRARMEKAAHLLKYANLSVSEVGYRVGYTNMSHFTRIFRKHFDINPKKYSSVG